jgi:hypothetical protein
MRMCLCLRDVKKTRKYFMFQKSIMPPLHLFTYYVYIAAA